ncbi:unnamed protein product [Adineta steineri]|uniref:Uncharacterized protein n=1 Tax=Adineta steineri TaxID=433720 RepID=A0A814AYY2_9BILA|nr:unnamed protein product [Adineta steineri]CAF4043124.1 unnamed protein product [Adineta steineri]
MLTKSPLTNRTNQLSSTLLIKPRVHTILNHKKHQINFEQIDRYSHKFNLLNLSNEKWLAMASSDKYILIGGGSSSSLRLFDLQGNEKYIIDIKTFAAFDLAWSNVLNAFLIAGYDRLQMYNVEKNQLTLVNNIDLINKKDNYLWSIACHGTDLFIVLSDGLESVWRLSLPKFQRIQTLSGSEIRESNSDDRISCIRTNGHSIGMTIRQRITNQWRVDLFDYNTMIRTHRGLTIGYGTGAFNFLERCMLTPINDDQWLIIGGYKVQPNALTLMDERTGEIKQIERQSDKQNEFISNICTSNNNNQQIITMIVMNNETGQRQIHVFEQ